jgi:hypothetical protein
LRLLPAVTTEPWPAPGLAPLVHRAASTELRLRYYDAHGVFATLMRQSTFFSFPAQQFTYQPSQMQSIFFSFVGLPFFKLSVFWYFVTLPL